MKGRVEGRGSRGASARPQHRRLRRKPRRSPWTEVRWAEEFEAMIDELKILKRGGAA